MKKEKMPLVSDYPVSEHPISDAFIESSKNEFRYSSPRVVDPIEGEVAQRLSATEEARNQVIDLITTGEDDQVIQARYKIDIRTLRKLRGKIARNAAIKAAIALQRTRLAKKTGFK